MMRHWWRNIAAPTLVRRLMVAQMLLLTALWTLATGFVINESGKDLNLLSTERIFDAVLAAADALADAPEQRQHVINMMDLAVRENYGTADDPMLSPSIVVQQRGREIYRSHGTPSELGTRKLNVVETFYAGDKRWRARSKQSASGTVLTMLAPADGVHIFITINSHGYYLLPLLISLPFLLLPTWLSIRLALRPWSQVAREVAARGPHNLRPLSYTAKHRELVGMVDNINTLMRQVDDSAVRERSFIADAAHELRTPLAAMQVNVEALHSQASDERQRQLLKGILSSGGRATRLVSQLLMLMRSDASAAGEAGAPVGLAQLLQDRMAALSGLASARQVELELHADTELYLHGQRESLISLVDNLVDNAIKYSPADGLVQVSLRREAGQAVLAVSDQGPGVAPALRERVLDRFFRDPNQTQSGSGLGLSIAQAVARQHGGSIALRDAGQGPGHGLLVEVRLPLAA
ncbi:sensor histidine kinase [Rugamonas sp. DEMB1]|uniref:sensor histidine kinase n=1 Tax=Rugamonas sp. DEMB1 TaxID=3039386 RepID=UPI0028BF45A5|nr:ATP-binding protein [Rugamonas sp. DEMB1]